jgi:hypothetical protein
MNLPPLTSESESESYLGVTQDRVIEQDAKEHGAQRQQLLELLGRRQG